MKRLLEWYNVHGRAFWLGWITCLLFVSGFERMDLQPADPTILMWTVRTALVLGLLWIVAWWLWFIVLKRGP